MWKWLQRKLGITALRDEGIILAARHRQVLTAVESLVSVLQTPCEDDSLIIFHLRAMGYCGGFK